MRKRRYLFSGFLLALLACGQPAFSQRTYASASVLATGNWFRIGITREGIYRMDLSFLQTLGIGGSGLPSNAVRLFGNGGAMLPEAASTPVTDDLRELALQVLDGGDGILNGSDYILFYAPGPVHWFPDPANRAFYHSKSLYSDTTYYYLTVSGSGRRITTAASLVATFDINTFTDRYVHELDTFNFLNSGKDWFGEEFSVGPGKTLSRTFPIPSEPAFTGPATLKLKAVARSFGGSSVFNITDGSGPIQSMPIAPVATGPYDQFARTDSALFSTVLPPDFSTLTVDFVPAGSNAQGWLDWFEFFPTRELRMTGNLPLFFRTWQGIGPGRVARFIIREAGNSLKVWDISRGESPVEQAVSLTGAEAAFSAEHDSLHEFVAFYPDQLPRPLPLGRVPNQNLHAPQPADLIIITWPPLLPEAARLAEFHRMHDSLQVVVATTDQVFNEFGSGVPDPVAIRNYVKMFYDRAGGDSTRRPRYLLLFGDASFDYKDRLAGNTNFVPAWQSPNALDPLSTYASDDFFGFLDDADDINSSRLNLLDIGIGRIPAKTVGEAKALVDKILLYHQPAALGPWRNEFSFVADDEDNNLHLQDAEQITATVSATAPSFNTEKIYLDAFRQQADAGGSRYPEANLLIENRLNTGNLIWNYSGHGGYRRLAEEVVLDQPIIDRLNNTGRLPLFITATCDVAPFDNPLIRSIGENLLLREKTGAVALMTTTRLVFAFSNKVMNDNYLRIALQRRADSSYLSLGEACRLTKNYTYQFSGDVINNRKFTLLGDPAMTLAFPRYTVVTTAINGKAPAADTLKAMSKYTVDGELRDASGNLLPAFNGTVYPVLYDKAAGEQTLGNDPGSLPVQFKTFRNIIYKGKATVEGGRFRFSFVVPRDINYQVGNGRLGYYADNGLEDGNGVNQRLLVGGTGDSLNDREGPSLKVFLNDERFISGGITNERPLLLVKLADSSGINILGNGIGHDLVATIDNDPKQQFVLNDYYQSDLNTFQKGSLRFQLPALAEGFHTLTVKAWDVMNNSGSASLDFRILKDAGLSLEHVLNYPNPFTTRTQFWFDHNRPGEELRVQVQVFTVTGKLVKTLRNTIISSGNRSNEVEWDGRDDYGNRIGRGVYIYSLRVQTADGKTAQKFQKLYIL